MRSDLRRLQWRLRAGVVRRAALEDAVAAAGRQLVDRRFAAQLPLQEVSPYVRPFLAIFEAEIASALRLAVERADRRAIEAVERAEGALEAARGMTRAHQEWTILDTAWTGLKDRFGLAAHAHFATLREGAAGLTVAQRFLEAGEFRKARFVVRLGQNAFDELTKKQADPGRRTILLRRHLEHRRIHPDAAEGLATALGRLVDDGFLVLAERLMTDWEMNSDALRRAASSDAIPAAHLHTIVEHGREAHRLAGELSQLLRDQEE